MEYYYKGYLDITIIKARLTRTTEFLLKQDPYVKLMINGTTFKSQTHKSGDVEPVWEYKFRLEIENIHDDVDIEVWDEDMNGDDLIGQTQIKMSALVVNSNQKEGVTDWFSLFYNNERVGLI